MEAELALQFRVELDKPWKKFVETALVTGVAYGSSFCVIFLVSTSCAPLLRTVFHMKAGCGIKVPQV